MARWIDALASRSGPLPNAAKLFAAQHGLERDPPRGVSGLCALHEILGSCVLESDEAERHFIEGAGAYFALVLLDHFADSAHEADGNVHRLRLGAHGSLDPFASIERVLQASHVRRALFSEVALAEAEAEGRGPVARVLAEASRQLGALPDARIVRRFDKKLWIEVDGTAMELDLTRIVDIARGESEETLQGAVRRMLHALVSPASAAEPWHAVRTRIFPRLVGRAFVDALPNPKSLYCSQLSSEVWVTLVLRYEGRARYVREDEIETWSKDGAQPRAQALQNLALASGRARLSRHETPQGPLVIAESRDGLDAARALLPGVHELLQRELGLPCVLGIPHRDTLLAASTKDPGAVEALRDRVREAALRAPHAITAQLLYLDERGDLSGLDDADAAVPARATDPGRISH